MLTSVLCVCVVTNILHEGLHIVSFYLGCCTSNYNLPTPLINEGGQDRRFFDRLSTPYWGCFRFFKSIPSPGERVAGRL